jgi:hypothetical protein
VFPTILAFCLRLVTSNFVDRYRSRAEIRNHSPCSISTVLLVIHYHDLVQLAMQKVVFPMTSFGLRRQLPKAVYTCYPTFSFLSPASLIIAASTNYTFIFCFTISSLSHIRIVHAATGPPSTVQIIIFTIKDIFEVTVCFRRGAFW